MDPVRLWLGTYPSSDDAPEQPSGVRRVDLLPDGTLVDRGTAAELPHASRVELHPAGRTLWATSETPDGCVVAYDVDGDTLTEVARLAAGGDYPCHLAIVAGPHDGALLVSNYGSGTLTVVPLDADGRPTGDGVTHVHLGSGPNPDRQGEAHVHSAWELPGGASAWVADLGADELRRYSLRPSGAEGEVRVEADGIGACVTPGSGPRHVAVHPADTLLGASWPRHHELVGEDLVLVASQGDACLVAVRVAEDGAGEVVGRLDLPVKPSCIVVD